MVAAAHGAVQGIGPVRSSHHLPYWLDLGVLALFCVTLFLGSFWNIRKRWIL